MDDNEELKTARLLEQMEAAEEEANQLVGRFSEKFVDGSEGIMTTIHDIVGSKMFNNWKAFEEYRNPEFFPSPTIKSSQVIDYCKHIDFGNPESWVATASVPDKIFCRQCYAKETARLVLSRKIENCCVCGNKGGKSSVTSVVPVLNIAIVVVMCGGCNIEVDKELRGENSD